VANVALLVWLRTRQEALELSPGGDKFLFALFDSAFSVFFTPGLLGRVLMLLGAAPVLLGLPLVLKRRLLRLALVLLLLRVLLTPLPQIFLPLLLLSAPLQTLVGS
jgi:hypothetical protein